MTTLNPIAACGVTSMPNHIALTELTKNGSLDIPSSAGNIHVEHADAARTSVGLYKVTFEGKMSYMDQDQINDLVDECDPALNHEEKAAGNSFLDALRDILDQVSQRVSSADLDAQAQRIQDASD